jgi:hypothetical protein
LLEAEGFTLVVFNLLKELFIEFTCYLLSDPAATNPPPPFLDLVVDTPTLKQGFLSISPVAEVMLE